MHGKLRVYQAKKMIRINRIMPKTNIFCRFGLLSICLFVSMMSAAKEQKATFVFAAFMPVIENMEQGLYPELATVLQQYRSQNPSTFFLFGGESLGPSPISSFDSGSHIIDILNSLEPDAMGVHYREFSYFEDQLSLRTQEAIFPLVASNLFDPSTASNLEGLHTSVILQRGQQKIGILSVIDDKVIETYLLKRIEVLEPCEQVRRQATELRNKGADLVLMLYEADLVCYGTLLTDKSVDLIFRVAPLSEMPQTNIFFPSARNILLQEQGQVAVVELTWDGEQKDGITVSTELLKLEDFTKEPIVSAQISQYMQRIDKLLSKNIGLLLTEFDTRRQTIRTSEAAFGNFITDSMRAYTDSDIGLINSGAIRGGKIYSQQSLLTRWDVARVLPFRHQLVKLQVSGQQILTALENGFSQIEQLRGKFPQLSGMQVTYDPGATPGQRVIQVMVGIEELQPRKLYSLTTTDYIAGGGDGYNSFKNATRLNYSNHTSPLVSEVVIRAILNQQQIAPKIEGRLLSLVANPVFVRK